MKLGVASEKFEFYFRLKESLTHFDSNYSISELDKGLVLYLHFELLYLVLYLHFKLDKGWFYICIVKFLFMA